MGAHPELLQKEKKKIIENSISNKQDKQKEITCFLDGKPIEKKSDIEFHNIKPLFGAKNKELSNFAVVCKSHHKELGELSLTEFLAMKEMQNFFKNSEAKKLNNVLKLKLGEGNFGKTIKVKKTNEGNFVEFLTNLSEQLSLDLKKSDKLKKEETKVKIPLLTCPSTGFQYFYFTIPVQYLANDEELQPRPLEQARLWELYRHLLTNSQLTPSVCRLANNKILLFDGQHKTAAQVWAGRKEIECKIYLEPDVKKLKETNLIAHDKLKQMPFFTSILINKWASIFDEEWKEYITQKGFKSELGFVSFLVNNGRKKSQAINIIESNIYDSIIEDKNNLILKYTAEYNNNSKSPITITKLKQSFLKKYTASPPLDIDIETSDKLREIERRNIIKFLNLIVRHSLEGKWDPEKNDKIHKISERIYLTGAFKAWSGILKDAIATILELFDENERKEIFLREISKEKWDEIEEVINFLFERRIWKDDSEENYNTLRLPSENQVRRYLSRRGISVNEILGKTGIFEDNFID